MRLRIFYRDAVREQYTCGIRSRRSVVHLERLYGDCMLHQAQRRLGICLRRACKALLSDRNLQRVGEMHPMWDAGSQRAGFN